MNGYIYETDIVAVDVDPDMDIDGGAFIQPFYYDLEAQTHFGTTDQIKAYYYSENAFNPSIIRFEEYVGYKNGTLPNFYEEWTVSSYYKGYNACNSVGELYKSDSDGLYFCSMLDKGDIRSSAPVALAPGFNPTYVVFRIPEVRHELKKTPDEQYKYACIAPDETEDKADETADMSFFEMDGCLYMLNGKDYLKFDGEKVVRVNSVDEAYVPTITISTPPTGGGTAYEDMNLLSNRFKQSFSSDGTALYRLSLKELNPAFVKVEVLGQEVTQGVDYTFDGEKRCVTFLEGHIPNNKTPNDVVIEAALSADNQDAEKNLQKIKQCRRAVLFGGDNDTRVFLYGSKEEPNAVYTSDIQKPSYFPENGFLKIGQETEAISGMVIQYNTLIAIKERSVWNISFSLQDGHATFPVRPINDHTGCVAPGSVALMQNNPVFLSGSGLYALIGSNVRDERNVSLLSQKINPLLLKRKDLPQAKAIVFQNKYYLCFQNDCFVYDIVRGVWTKYNNIPASQFCAIGNELYFGSETEGMLYRFKNTGHSSDYNDDGYPIYAYWKSKWINFGNDFFKKLVAKLFVSYKNEESCGFTAAYVTDAESGATLDNVVSGRINFAHVDFSRFSFLTTDASRHYVSKIKAKKCGALQLTIQNNEQNSALKLLSLGLKFVGQGEHKW